MLKAETRKIFVIHPSPLVTDFQAHGDGLLAHRYIVELAARGHRVVVACEAVRLLAPVPENVTFYPLHLKTSRLGLLNRVEYAWRMRRLFAALDRTEHFDVAHQFNPVFAGLSLGLLGRDIPVVLGPYVAHWPFKRASRLKTFFLDGITRLQQHFADAVLLSGAAARERLLSKRISTANTYTVPYGIDLEQFPHAAFPAGHPMLLYLGGLAERKGILVLLEAFELVAARAPAAQLVVAGDGPERDRVHAIVEASSYRDRIRLLGSVSRENVPELIAASTLFCLPSFGEPYGMSLIEAMATGRPVVATDVGGPRHLVDPRGGYLVPPGDAQALAEALLLVIENPDAAREMGAYNRGAMNSYAWPSVVDKLEQAYESVIHGRQNSRH